MGQNLDHSFKSRHYSEGLLKALCFGQQELVITPDFLNSVALSLYQQHYPVCHCTFRFLVSILGCCNLMKYIAFF